jgi:uncharacterized membrane protein YgdD (TMEM256/DUF423 family)
MNWRFWALAGSIAGGLAVVIGAFAAHQLKAILSPESMDIFKTAHFYQMFHAIALILNGFAAMKSDLRAFQIAGVAFLAGIILFSGSLYTLAISGASWMGMVAPLGGLAFIVGWVFLGYGMSLIDSH